MLCGFGVRTFLDGTKFRLFQVLLLLTEEASSLCVFCEFEINPIFSASWISVRLYTFVLSCVGTVSRDCPVPQFFKRAVVSSWRFLDGK